MVFKRRAQKEDTPFMVDNTCRKYSFEEEFDRMMDDALNLMRHSGIIINRDEFEATKNRKDRVIPLTQEMKEMFATLKKIEMKKGYLTEFVFSNNEGRIHAPVLSSCIRNKCKQVGIDPKGIHNIRKTFNSMLVKCGASAKEASILLGHSEEVNHKHYTFDVYSDEEKLRAVESSSLIKRA